MAQPLGMDYTPSTTNTWQSYGIASTDGYYWAGGYECGPVYTVTLNAGSNVSNTSSSALIHFYETSANSSSLAIVVYDMSNNIQGVVGQAGRDGDGKSYGMAGEIIVNLSNRQFKLKGCRNGGAYSTVYFKAKGVIN